MDRKRRTRSTLILSGGCLIGLGLLGVAVRQSRSSSPRWSSTAPATGSAGRIVEGARDEVRRGVTYDAGYEDIPYPNGDVGRDHGACTDVVIRSFRAAGFDLQRLVHEDMKAHFRDYPHKWHLSRTDTNIDHRRVPNLATFFRRHGSTLPTDTVKSLASWKPGDVVTWKLNNGLDHCGIISDRRNDKGVPFAIHNIGLTAEEDTLNTWQITGHYRYPKK